ncbi:T6SS effector BTH_I2691 family protein [Pseudomonadota bacterium AL_CKDN230030165-1A_HGKHYDSX7]
MSYEPIPPDGKPYPLADTTCQKCGRSGLPLLLVRPGVVDRRQQDALATVTRLYDQTLDADFLRISRKGTVPVTRLLREGYVYVYYQARGVWDVWRVFPDSTYKKLLEQASAAQYAGEADALAADEAGFVCSRGAANVPANLISLIGPQNQPAIWIAYADHLWTPEVLQRYAASDSQARPKRMTKIDGVALIKQGEKPPNSTVLSAPTLQAFLPEFSPAMPEAGPSHHPALRVFERCDPPLASAHFSLAQPLDVAARAMEETAGPDAHRKGLVLMVHDPIGVAQDYNVARLGINDERQNWMAGGMDASGGGADADRPWKRQSLMLASYVREAVRQNARKNAEDLYNSGALKGSITISESEYQRVRADEAAGKSRYPAGTTYERLNTVPVVYRVTWSREAVESGLEGVAQSDSQSRVARYDGHLDDTKIEQERVAWDEQNAAWTALQEARDEDYVAWLQGEVLLTALRHDYDNRRFLEEELRDTRKRDADMRDATARLIALSRCYGGGICGYASRQHMIKMIAKDERDPDNVFAATIFEPLGLTETLLSDPVSQATLYDALVGNREKAVEEFRAGWAAFRAGAAVHLAIAFLVVNQTTLEMQRLLASPALARQLGLESQVAFARRKQALWTRGSALADFLDSDQRRYVVRVVTEKLVDASDGSPVRVFRVDRAPGLHGRRADRASDGMRRARAVLGERGLHALEGGSVYLVVDEADLRAASPGMPTVEVTTHDLGGRPRNVRLPADLVDGLLRKPAVPLATRLQASAENFIKPGGRLPGIAAAAVIMLQSRALMQTLDDARQTGGLRRLEAVAALLSASSGIAGAVLELGAIAVARPVAAAGGLPPAAMLAGTIPWSVRLRLAGGLFAGAGALFDSATAFLRSAQLRANGDSDAAAAAEAQGALQFVGGWSIVVGTALYWFVIQNLGREVAVRVGAGFVGTVVFSGALAGWLVAGGLFLWIAGVGVSFLVNYLSDDACEIWLDRSYFGLHQRSEGAFEDVKQELEAFGALARGITVDAAWDKAWFGNDEVRATIASEDTRNPSSEGQTPAAQQRRVVYRIDGFEDRYKSKAISVLDQGVHVIEAEGPQGWSIEIRAEVADARMVAARLHYTLFDGKEAVLGDSIWISK